MGADAGDRDWADYYAAQAGRPPRPLLAVVLGSWQRAGTTPGFAIDLGCGDGADTVELIRHGWAVLAIDRQPAAIALVERNVPEPHRPRLQTRVADFTALPLPAADLIYCGWSLPHCPAAQFTSTWHTIRAALRPRGWVAAHLLGHRDDWACDPASPAFGRDALGTLLAGLDVEHLEEIEEDRGSFDGPKHWHYYEIIARQPERARTLATDRSAATPQPRHPNSPNGWKGSLCATGHRGLGAPGAWVTPCLLPWLRHAYHERANLAGSPAQTRQACEPCRPGGAL